MSLGSASGDSYSYAAGDEIPLSVEEDPQIREPLHTDQIRSDQGVRRIDCAIGDLLRG
jgi:hypothetical protein